jgi:hypothetical protein
MKKGHRNTDDFEGKDSPTKNEEFSHKEFSNSQNDPSFVEKRASIEKKTLFESGEPSRERGTDERQRKPRGQIRDPYLSRHGSVDSDNINKTASSQIRLTSEKGIFGENENSSDVRAKHLNRRSDTALDWNQRGSTQGDQGLPSILLALLLIEEKRFSAFFTKNSIKLLIQIFVRLLMRTMHMNVYCPIIYLVLLFMRICSI